VVQAVLSGCNEQVVPLQTLGGVQSVFTVQDVLQISLVVSHAKAMQEAGAAAAQVPVPLQTEAGV
jgi:hypothetical protein